MKVSKLINKEKLIHDLKATFRTGLIKNTSDVIKVVDHQPVVNELDSIPIKYIKEKAALLRKQQHNCHNDSAYWGYERDISALKHTLEIWEEELKSGGKY